MGQVRDNFEELLKKELIKYYKDELEIDKETYENQTFNTLTSEEIEILAEKIDNLSFESRIVLLSKYYFKTSPEDTKEVFEIKDPKEKSIFLNHLLSKQLKVEGLIDDESFEKACEIVIKLEEQEARKIGKDITIKPKYNGKTEKILKEAGINTKRRFIHFSKKAAAILLITTISLGLFLSTNTTAREKLFDWFITDYGIYSEFIPEEINKDYMEILEISDLEINYIPDGFELDDVQEGVFSHMYTYVNTNNKEEFFVVRFTDLTLAKNGSNLDTENSVLEPITINNNDGYYWYHDPISSVLWQHHGIENNIHGNISKAEIIKISENILKK